MAAAFTLALAFGVIPLAFAQTGNTTDGATSLTATEAGIKPQAVQPAKAFMDPPEQLNKPSEVDGTNWMSAIPGERRITEYNVPYAHDSATKNISGERVLFMGTWKGVTSLTKSFGKKYAQTQLLTVPEQLNSGVRVLDVRMNNVGPTRQVEMPPSAMDLNLGPAFKDDGENLWIAHGRKEFGTFYAMNADQSIVSVAQVLGEVKQFLTDHPTETITILFTVESQEYSKVHDKCFYRLRDHLQKLADEKNPSTGKPYLYREEGHGFFDMYTHIPQLKDCRGQLVIEYDSEEGAEGIIGGMFGMGGIGYMMPGDVKTMREPGNNSVDANKKIMNLCRFMRNEENWHPISRSVTPHLDYYYFMSLATHTEDTWDYIEGLNTPLDMAKEINEEFFDKEDAFFKQNGIYFGWVKMDGIKAKYAERIWRSNFTGDDYLDFCTVTVKSGLDGSPYPDQQYTVVKGTPITLPECLYDYDPKTDGKFGGWRLQDSLGSRYTEQPGETVTVDSDMTVTALWDKEVKDEVMVRLVPGGDDVALPDGYVLGGDSTCLFKAPFDQKFGNLGLDQTSRSGYTLDGWYTSRGVKMTDERRLKDDVFDIENGEYATIEDGDFTYRLITLTARWSKHPMRAPEYSWADDLSTCTATRHCTQEGCTECTETETVSAAQEVVTPPGCKNKGQTIYTAEFENPAFTTQKKERYPANLGHSWQDPTYEWSADNGTVTATRICARENAHQESEIVETTSEVTKQPTDDEEGETTYTATFQNEAFATQAKTVANIPALGHEHEWGEPTYTWSDDGSIVVAKRVCSKNSSHIEQESVPALRKTTREASCKETGTYTRTANFENEAFETQTRDFEEPKLDCEVLRISVIENVVEPTCTEMGSQDAVFYCLVCGGEWERTEMRTPALGHRWGAWSQTKAPTCSAAGLEERICKNDASHKETREVAADPDAHAWGAWKVTKAATCEAAGLEQRTCAHDASHVEKRAVKATGHKWGAWQTVKKPTALNKGEKRRVCKNNSAHVQKKQIKATGVSGVLLARMVAKGNGFTLSWTKVTGAEGYDVFFSPCSSADKTNVLKKAKTIKGNTTLSWSKTGLKKGVAYTASVRAWAKKGGKKQYVMSSTQVHAYAGNAGDGRTNAKKVTAQKAKVTLRTGKSFKIKASVVGAVRGKPLMSNEHAVRLRYLSSNAKVAKVNKSGKVTAKAKGSCKIYAYAHNGVRTAVSVTVR